MFYANEELIKKRLAENNVNHSPEVAPQQQNKVQASTPQVVTEATSVTTPVTIESVNIPAFADVESTETHFIRYFDDPKNLHRVLCTLVLLCNMDVKFPFSFKLFEQALNDSNVPGVAGLPLALIRPFLHRNLITRINPDAKPPRYSITQAAINFAEEDIPKSIVLEKKHRQNKKIEVVEIPENTFETLSALKKTFAEHQAILDRLHAEKNKLGQLKKENIEDAERDIVSQIRNLQARIVELEKASKDLAQRRTDIATVEREIERLQHIVNNPTVQKKLGQFEKFRQLLQ